MALARPEGQLACLAPCHQDMGPTSQAPGAGELYHCRRLCMGGAARVHLTHMTSAGASGPLPSWLVWSWGQWLGRGQGRADLEGAGARL